MMMLQRRIQMPEPNLQAIAKNAASATASTKEVIARCMNALGWIASPQHTAVSSRRNVDAAAGPLAIELTAQALKISNVITDDAAAVPQKKLGPYSWVRCWLFAISECPTG